jgi:putative intracellular protease/amidase
MHTSNNRPVLIALPSRDFDPSEVAVPWSFFKKVGLNFVFGTTDGERAFCDPKLIDGVLFGQLGALSENVNLYQQMEQTAAFRDPVRFEDLDVESLGGIILPGGHAQGMRAYLEDTSLRRIVRDAAAQNLPIGAICHGTVVLARTILAKTGRSVIHGKRVTTLPKRFECAAWLLTAWKLGGYYRTYSIWVEEEVGRAVGDPRWSASEFEGGSVVTGSFLARYDRPWVVRDGMFVTGRWPGDAQKFAETFWEICQECGR